MCVHFPPRGNHRGTWTSPELVCDPGDLFLLIESFIVAMSACSPLALHLCISLTGHRVPLEQHWTGAFSSDPLRSSWFTSSRSISNSPACFKPPAQASCAAPTSGCNNTLISEVMSLVSNALTTLGAVTQRLLWVCPPLCPWWCQMHNRHSVHTCQTSDYISSDF